MVERALAEMTESELRVMIDEAIDKRLSKQVNFALPSNYDAEKDPFSEGLFEGPSDLSMRTKDILRKDFPDNLRKGG